jgi:PPOX class probable FMN-dependent enzyme
MTDTTIRTMEALEALYPKRPGPIILRKEIDHLNPGYRAIVEASPFIVISTAGPGGMDVSPRGGNPGFVRVFDEKTLVIPDRAGNNRLDSMRNLLVDDRIAVMFLIPHIGEMLRVQGTATISVDPEMIRLFPTENPPRSLLVVHVESAYFQCSRSAERGRIWDTPRDPLVMAGLATKFKEIEEWLRGTP